MNQPRGPNLSLGGDAVAISAGGYHTCVLKATGNVDCYGGNWAGQSADYYGPLWLVAAAVARLETFGLFELV